MTDYETVLHFWFKATEPAAWWTADAGFDDRVRAKFSAVHERACRGELSHWRSSAHGRLAEVIVLDQFSRNIHRGNPRAFAQDLAALVLAQEAVATGDDAKLTLPERSFLYLPFMHSESLSIHLQAQQLYLQPGLESNYDFELKHKAIIDRFGRYPHRNSILGRKSTHDEIEFLKQPGSGF